MMPGDVVPYADLPVGAVYRRTWTKRPPKGHPLHGAGDHRHQPHGHVEIVALPIPRCGTVTDVETGATCILPPHHPGTDHQDSFGRWPR